MLDIKDNETRKGLVCYKCFEVLKKDTSLSVTQGNDNPYDCICTELDHDIDSPSPCISCRDPKMAGCPMHLHYVKVKRI